MYQRIKNTTSLIRSKLALSDDFRPRVGLILGSGLGSLVQDIDQAKAVDFSAIEGFATSSVAGHNGRFVVGKICSTDVIVMQGRVHHYEGYSMEDVTLGVRAMCDMGIQVLIVTNAAGGVNDTFAIGDVMMIEDHINLLPNPLIGQNIDQIGTRFPDMTEAYSKRLKTLTNTCATELGIKLQHGIYLASTGPSYETPAEYEFFHRIGADACGMSTTPEVIVARHAGVEVLGFSAITNIGRGQAANAHNSHNDVIDASAKAAATMRELIKRCIQKLK